MTRKKLFAAAGIVLAAVAAVYAVSWLPLPTRENPDPAPAPDNSAAAETQEWTRDRVATLYNGACEPCHTNPDTRFETDRAWLEQLRQTA